ncbi:TPA: hypothetical protein SL665_001569 [Pseudomonas aeruginosa]|uniref:hypothetical protein n=1 Tax=Pseudomonas aeruginosa TaxID=287 RepID=UPI001141414C|nr:hypothetical protein [Pseudomonas aeruginosa]HBP1684382.1 hypothetical protein [Pseudomonas aeruginosa]HEJ3875258.1 hypothetical protein [Pseudomonas aeruginosa]HEJ5077331.1 hypothetical protein [Pseudomonas aeruginosa]HEJ6441799.1 hypothetical protein [Pseudomonas aeruginosa]HEJ9715216.1 hypothetical protein [Pseudomonas aeruginosa]
MQYLVGRQAEQRQTLAEKTVEQARQQASGNYAAAQRLLRERSEGDDCAAARTVIDRELGL